MRASSARVRDVVVRLARFALAALGVVAVAGWGIAVAEGQPPPPGAPIVAALSPKPGDVVGVSTPVVVQFVAPVIDRVAAERAITVGGPETLPGRFTWMSDVVVHWTPDDYWPARTPVMVRAGEMTTTFQTGSVVMSVADISAHTFTVSIDGEVVREMPASMGKSGFDTPVGSFRVLEKQREVLFDSRTIGIPLDSSEGYLIDGEYAVRITWGGVYVHSAPWSLGYQGYSNVSHGCINLSPEDAAWYFDTVNIGDPVIVQA